MAFVCFCQPFVEMVREQHTGRQKHHAAVATWNTSRHSERCESESLCFSVQLTCSSDKGQVWQCARPTLSLICRLYSSMLQHFTSTLLACCQSEGLLSLSLCVAVSMLLCDCRHMHAPKEMMPMPWYWCRKADVPCPVDSSPIKRHWYVFLLLGSF